MFGRRQPDDEWDDARRDQSDGRSGDFVDPWGDQDHNRAPGGNRFWEEPDDRAGNSGSNGQRRAGGQGPGGQSLGGPGLGGSGMGGPAMSAQGFGDSPWGEPRPGRPDPEDGPFGRRHARDNQRDNFREGSRDDLRGNPRNGLHDDYRDGPRDDYRDGPRGNPRNGLRDDYRDGPRGNPRNGLRDDYRDGPRDDYRDGPRDNPRDGLRDDYREGPRDNGGPAGRHSSVRSDWREVRDAGPWGQPEPEMAVPGFTPAATALPAVPGGAGNSRPVGRLLIFTLREEQAAEFDRLAEQAAEGVRVSEPDTLVYVYHTLPTLPAQRIIYEIYRDRAAFESHQRQPYIQRFTDEIKPLILGSNTIDLRLKYAKVAPLQGAGQPRGQPAALPPADGQSPAGLSSGGRADAQSTARHRAPRSLEAASRSLGEDRAGGWSGEQAGSAGGGRRAESADDWASGRDWRRS